MANGERLNKFQLKSRTRQECPLLSLPVIIILELVVNSIRQKKELNCTIVEKKEAQLSCFSPSNMGIYIENLRDSAEKLF